MADAADEIVGTMFPVTEQAPPTEAPQAAPPPELQVEAPPPIAPVEAAPPPVETPLAPAEPPQGGHIPIQALLDEREKRQGLQRERDELLAWRQQQESQQQAPQRPDLYDDPEGFAAWQQSELAQARWDTTLEVSSRFAAEKHGQETVVEANGWAHQAAQRDPTFVARFQSQKDPVGWLVGEFKRDRLLSEIGDDPDAYVRRRAAELGAGSGIPPVAAPAAAFPQSPSAPPPPRSQAGLPSAGGGHQTVPVHSMAALEGLFPKG